MKLWEPTKCCCCCDVRTGCIVLSILLLVGSSFSLLGGVQTLTSGDYSRHTDICRNEPDEEQCIQDFTKIELSTTISSMVFACFHIIFSSLLLYGVVKKKTSFFIPLMTIYVIQIAILILASAAAVIFLIYVGVPFTITFMATLILGLMIFLETYCLLVIRAHYLEIKRAKGQIHTSLNDRNMEDAPPYSDSQVPAYPGNEVPPYPSSDVPLYVEKFPK